MTERVVLVGCGQSKQNPTLEPGKLLPRTWPARELYTSTYFRLKREYAETIGDQWAILSAEHGLVFPWEELEPYDTSIDDLDQEEIEAWAEWVVVQLEEWFSFDLSEDVDAIEVDILAGTSYVDPLRPTFELVRGPIRFRYPFDDTAGIGEQMGWLKKQVAAHSEPPIPGDD